MSVQKDLSDSRTSTFTLVYEEASAGCLSRTAAGRGQPTSHYQVNCGIFRDDLSRPPLVACVLIRNFSMSEPSFKYRADIDGLRALAILPVVFFHADLPGFSGGFVGVDIFFVISGFLITGIILREQQEQRFTFRGFWTRRARRIFPALGAVVFTSLVVGWFVLMPEDYRNLARTTIAQATFSSNISFYRHAGYFAAPAESSPLLHTWSLAVEEQFYFLFPLLLVILGKRHVRWRIPVLLGLFVGSLAWSIWQVEVDASGAFYLVQSRAWELLAGALLAIWLSKPSVRNQVTWRDEFAALLGFVAIAAAVFLFDRHTPFPGSAALLPCMGAVLLIWANRGEPTAMGRLLSLHWVVWVGLISYSLYLWHWPVLVFSRYILHSLTPALTVVALAASILLAWMSYRWIETPVRRCRVLVSQKQLLAGSVLMLLMFVFAGKAIRLSNGVPARLNDEAQKIYLDAVRKPPPCETVPLAEKLELCQRGAPDEAASLLVWGDSHAYALLAMLDEFAQEQSFNYLIYGCVPVVDVYVAHWAQGIEDYDCTKSTQALFDYLKLHPVKDTLLAARWALYVEGRDSDAPDGSAPNLFFGDRLTAPTDVNASRSVFARQLPETVARLRMAGSRVTVLKQVPPQLFWVPNDLARAIESDDDIASLGRPLESHRRRQVFVDGVFDRLGDAALILDPADELCQPDGLCRAARNGRSLYFDDDHLTEYGAKQLKALFTPMFTIDSIGRMR